MPWHLKLGRRKNDFGFVVDFRRKSAILRLNTSFIEGVYLERIPPGLNDFKPGMVLVRAEWDKIYFLCERDGWTEDDYFKFAEKRMKELGITKP